MDISSGNGPKDGLYDDDDDDEDDLRTRLNSNLKVEE